MKGVLVFNSLPDLSFVHGDEEFRSYWYRRAVKDGLLLAGSSTEFSDQLFQNAIIQLCSPLVASQQYMQTKNPYTSIKCQSGLIFVFERHEGLIYFGINGDKSETESFIRRKLRILHRLVLFFHGPVVQEIKPSQSSGIGIRWKSLSSVLDTWCRLAEGEQCFLVEAIERLHVAPDLSSKAIELLESAILTFKNSGDKHAVHGLMLARTNLLGLFSSKQASELESSDMLMIILIVQDMFQNNTDTLDDLFATPIKKDSIEKPSAWSDMLAEMNLEDADEGDDEDSDSAQYFSISSDSTEETAVQSSGIQYPSMPSISRSMSAESTGSTSHIPVEYHKTRTVYLRTPYCKYTPHTIHCMQIYPGLTLVVFSEITKSKQIGTLCMLFNILADLMSDNPSGGKYKLERLESIIKKLLEALKKFRGPTQRISSDIQKNWDYCKNNGLNQWLEIGCTTQLSMGLLASVKQLDQVLKKLFTRLSMATTEMSELTIAAVKQSFVERMDDYRAFLAVKAQRNITMTSYIEEFPGMVHFIYVDRKYDHVFAPSINIVTSAVAEPLDATHMIKNKIWDMVHWCQDILMNGYIAATKLEGDYYYSYYLWFEDVSGNPLIVQTEYTANSIPGPPGVLSTRFYHKLIRHCFPQAAQRSVHCYEMMCVHIGIVPPDFTVKHCRRLAASLWESSGEINSTLNLL